MQVEKALLFHVRDEVALEWREDVAPGVDMDSDGDAIARATDSEDQMWNTLVEDLKSPSGDTRVLIVASNDRYHEAIIVMRRNEQEDVIEHYQYLQTIRQIPIKDVEPGMIIADPSYPVLVTEVNRVTAKDNPKLTVFAEIIGTVAFLGTKTSVYYTIQAPTELHTYKDEYLDEIKAQFEGTK